MILDNVSSLGIALCSFPWDPDSLESGEKTGIVGLMEGVWQDSCQASVLAEMPITIKKEGGDVKGQKKEKKTSKNGTNELEIGDNLLK